MADSKPIDYSLARTKRIVRPKPIDWDSFALGPNQPMALGALLLKLDAHKVLCNAAAYSLGGTHYIHDVYNQLKKIEKRRLLLLDKQFRVQDQDDKRDEWEATHTAVLE